MKWGNAPIIMALLFAGLLSAQRQPGVTCGLPHISKIPAGAPISVESLQKSLGVTFLIRKNVLSGDNSFITVDFTSMYSDAEFEIFAETAELDAGRITAAGVDGLVRVFRDFTASKSIDSTRGIKAIADDVFGAPPDVDGNGKVYILLVDVRDDYVAGVSESFVAGYFDPVDQGEFVGNMADIIYLDSFPASLTDSSEVQSYSTLAHEYQHLIHFGRDQNEELWVNEGLSELSPTLMGLPHRSFSHYLSNTNVAIDIFEGLLADYARTALFFLYSWVQLGTSFVKDLTSNPLNGLTGFAGTLSNYSSFSIDDFVYNWHLANYLDGPAELGYGGQFLVPKPILNKIVLSYPDEFSPSVKKYGVYWALLSRSKFLNLTASSGPQPKITLFRGNNPVPEDGSSLYTMTFTDPNLGDTYHDLYIMVSAGNQAAGVTFSAKAQGRLEEQTISYDEDAPLSEQTFFGLGEVQAVTGFNLPDSVVDISSLEFLPFSSEPVILRLYRNALSPDNLMFSDTIRAAHALTWHPYRLPAKLLGSVRRIYVGISTEAMGYNDRQMNDLSFIANSNASSTLSLDSINITGIGVLTGNWSIRLSYLVPGEPLPTPIPDNVITQFYVNPFEHDGTAASFVQIGVDLLEPVEVTLYNILGQEVRVINREEGNLVPLRWDGVMDDGRPAPSGVYLALVRVGSIKATRKLVLIR